MRRRNLVFCTAATSMVALAIAVASAQFGRRHTVTKSGVLRPVPATASPPVSNQVSITVQGDYRVIESNGIPEHRTGAFPNRGNPNALRAQRYRYRIAANPTKATETTPLSGVFGIAINGVPFDPGAAEFYMGQMGSQWQYEPLSGAISLGIDVSHAHVQPNGAYHYHGLPTGLLDSVKLSETEHSPIVGWAADGFPIYAVYGFADPDSASSDVVALESSFELKQGKRPGASRNGSGEPGGTYDGTFVADYEYKAESGDLDECNGRFTVTPDFPDGTYAYFLTEDWPVIPRSFRGTPASEFLRRGRPGQFFPPGRRPPPGQGPGGRRPPRRPE